VLRVFVAIHHPVEASRCGCTLVRALHAIILGHNLENELSASVVCAHTCTYAHTHKCLFIYLQSLSRQKGRLGIVWMNNSRTTCLNTGRVKTSSSKLQLMGLPSTFDSMLAFFFLPCLIHMHFLMFCSLQPLYSHANGFLLAYTHSLDTFTYSFSLEASHILNTTFCF
jgi:hypothetical protein